VRREFKVQEFKAEAKKQDAKIKKGGFPVRKW
jgi:hypothetical protein